jgi:hypothetical protein
VGAAVAALLPLLDTRFKFAIVYLLWLQLQETGKGNGFLRRTSLIQYRSRQNIKLPLINIQRVQRLFILVM